MGFATELTRAAAQRGKLDPLYRELSDDRTLILQRLFPVWALIGPGLAEPGHIELRSRTVYLDSDELLGTRQDILTGALERRAILRTYGVAIHEVFHAKHTNLWISERDRELAVSDDTGERQLAADRALLEEPRMEAQAAAGFPPTAAADASCVSRWRPQCSTASSRASPRNSWRHARYGRRSRATWRAAQ
jgi:hypothetical protein